MFNYKPSCYSIDSNNPIAAYNLSSELTNLILSFDSPFTDIAVLCIGTDRSTGDCLGPLVGYKLTTTYLSEKINVFGTLENPVHAKNLPSSIESLYARYSSPLIIAIDASLGKSENVGKINLFKGPLTPGSGVNKKLDSIGDISITGIVNISGYMEYMILQNTRLSFVMQIADVISHGLYESLHNIKSKEII